MLNNFYLYLYHLLTYKLNLVWLEFVRTLMIDIGYVMCYGDDGFTYHRRYLREVIRFIIYLFWINAID